MALELALPRFVVLKKSNSNGKYLCPLLVGDRQTYGSLQFSGEKVLDPSAKYEVEAADDGLVHIRNCYNNKYWARGAEDDYRIVAQATEPEIDGSKWSCTLFKPIVHEDARTVRFGHVQLNGHVFVMPSSDIAVSQTQPGVEFDFIDWESLFVLPKHVAFKANNDCYLSVPQTRYSCFRCIFGHNYLQFTGKDITDPTVRNDIFVTADGYVRIRSHCHNSFWRRDPRANWIRADSNNNDPVADDLFWPVKISDKEIALRSKGNNLHCERNAKNRLRASAVNITQEAYLLMEETVLSRRIRIVKFHPGIRERLCPDVEVGVSEETINKGSKEMVSILRFSYSNAQSRTWSSSISRKLEGQATIKVTIPINLQLQLGISGEIVETIEEGEREETSYSIKVTKRVTVPPKTASRVIVLGLEQTLEIPFSYIQSDTLTDGTYVNYQNDHGIYIQKKFLKFKQLIEERKIED